MDRSDRQPPISERGDRTPPDALDPAELAELDRRLRALARALVGDPSLADDVVQEAWLTLLRRVESRPRRLRGWLDGVVRHHAADSWQQRRRREARERRAGRPERTPGPPETLEAGETRDVLASTIDRIAEPYRTTLRLRFIEGLELDEIAARTGCANGTVRSRLSRGMVELRRRLDQRFGDRSRWSVFLAPYARKTGAPLRPFPAALSPIAVLVALPLVLGAVLLGAYLLQSRHVALEVPRIAGRPPARPGPTEEPSTAATLAERREAAAGPQESEPPPTVDESAEVPPRSVLARLEVRVVDAWGAPARESSAEVRGPRGVRVVQSRSDTILVEVSAQDLTPFDGEDHVLVRAHAPGEAASTTAFVPLRLAHQPLVLATTGPACELTVVVRDAQGEPVPGAAVRVSAPGVQGYETLDSGIRTQRTPQFGSTDPMGKLLFPHVERRVRRIHVDAEGFVAAELEIDADREELLVPVLLDRGGRLLGRARMHDGTPAGGAEIELVQTIAPGLRSRLPATRADADGVFELGVLPREPHVVLARLTTAEGAQLLASTIVAAAGEAPLVWDPVLVPHHGLVLALVDERGAPLRAARTVLAAELGSGRYPAYVQIRPTDEMGVVRFLPLPDATHYLMVQRGVNDLPVVARGLRAGRSPDEVSTIVVPPPPGSAARIEGVLLESDGTPAQRARLRFDRMAELALADVEPSTGRFVLADAVAGEYEILALVDGRGAVRYGTRTVSAGEHVDLGVRRLPAPVPVRFVWRAPNSPTPTTAWAVCIAPASGVGRVATIATLDSSQRALPLFPGSYHLMRGDIRTPTFEVPEGVEQLEVVIGE